MKILNTLCFLFILILSSCNSNDVEYETINIATPVTITKVELRSSIEVLPPQNIAQAGKIYAYNNYIFINDNFEGIHIIDNTNPESPLPLSYIKLKGNMDISIKNNFLYADTYSDLVVFNISNINAITRVEILEDVFNVYDYQEPEGMDEVNYNAVDFTNDVIIDWVITQEQREVNTNSDATINIFESASVADVGVGGSLARFKIVDNYLYTVDSFEMDVFNISNVAQPALVNSLYAGWNIETLFYADNHLYLGGTNGMYIYGLIDPSSPNYISEFTHWEGCDPVVVDGDYAYLTLRGGNLCGQNESVLEVIDVSDKTNPQLVATHILENPYGLGFKNEALFVCDGTAGLKIYNKSNPLNLQLLSEHPNVQAKDVIPLNNSIIMISDAILYQFEYEDNNMTLLSTLQL